MIGYLLDPLIALAFPRSCRVCGGSVESLGLGPACNECWSATHLYTGIESACGKCSRPLHDIPSGITVRCPQCVEHYYDRAVSAAEYGHAVRAVVLALKSEPFLPPKAAGVLCDAFERSGFHMSGLIVPVPLSRKRQKERGFNQAELLADVLGGHTGIRVSAGAIRRTAHFGMHRAGMDRKAREESVKGSFEVVTPRLIAEESILLVDDVFTTGSTVSACAKALKASKAKEVYVLTLARTGFW